MGTRTVWTADNRGETEMRRVFDTSQQGPGRQNPGDHLIAHDRNRDRFLKRCRRPTTVPRELKPSGLPGRREVPLHVAATRARDEDLRAGVFPQLRRVQSVRRKRETLEGTGELEHNLEPSLISLYFGANGRDRGPDIGRMALERGPEQGGHHGTYLPTEGRVKASSRAILGVQGPTPPPRCTAAGPRHGPVAGARSGPRQSVAPHASRAHRTAGPEVMRPRTASC